MKNDAPSASAFTALADPTRRRILKMLRAGSQSAGQIADAFHLTKPTLSHHFKVLREAGLAIAFLLVGAFVPAVYSLVLARRLDSRS